MRQAGLLVAVIPYIDTLTALVFLGNPAYLTTVNTGREKILSFSPRRVDNLHNG
jgi:hypothetical protein